MRTNQEVPLYSIQELNQKKQASKVIVCPVVSSENTYAVIVEGDAMQADYSVSPIYPTGSVIFIDPSQSHEAGHMDIVAVTLPESSDLFSFRRLQVEDGQRYLTPINPKYPPMVGVPFKVIGKVVGGVMIEL